MSDNRIIKVDNPFNNNNKNNKNILDKYLDGLPEKGPNKKWSRRAQCHHIRTKIVFYKNIGRDTDGLEAILGYFE